MRLILSRKGFDSAAGGCPSPVFPDNTFYSLPIPDNRSRVTYGELHHGRFNIGDVVTDLTGGGCGSDTGAHLDPDIHRTAYPRRQGWRPIFGQTGAAQGHLRRQQVQAGDIFLFFGLFRRVENTVNGWRFIKSAPPCHALWGWLQISSIITVDKLRGEELRWARYHPHFHLGADAGNTLYVNTDRLRLGTQQLDVPGAGVFPRFEQRQLLTAPQAKSPSCWRLPSCFLPGKNTPPLSYHGRPERWRRGKGCCYLNSVARGQEFVLDTGHYPRVVDWLRALLLR